MYGFDVCMLDDVVEYGLCFFFGVVCDYECVDVDLYVMVVCGCFCVDVVDLCF